jgi:hypothetical protein
MDHEIGQSKSHHDLEGRRHLHHRVQNCGRRVIVQKLNTALRAVIDSADVQASFKNVGFEGFSSTPEELGAFIKVQLGVWEKMIKDADIKPN